MNKKQKTVVIVWTVLTLFIGAYITYRLNIASEHYFVERENYLTDMRFAVMIALTVWATLTAVAVALLALFLPSPRPSNSN